MTRQIAFVATELDPVVPGGAGAVVAGLADLLARAGAAPSVVLVADRPITAPPGVRVATAADAGQGAFLARSRAAATAVAALVDEGPPDLVEFQDFDGLGFWALSHRHELGLEEVAVGVRVHGPVDLMTAAMGLDTAPLREAAAMERETFAMADFVVVPSRAIGALVAARYELEAERMLVGPPPVPHLAAAVRTPAPRPEFVAYGRLGEVKGSQDFLDAALLVAERRADVRFRFVGPDGWSVAADRPMEEWLRSRIPARHADRFSFEGPAARADVGAKLATAWAVVVPSRFETFCLAAHEVRRLGLPLVVPDLAAFRDFFSPATGAAIYDGSPEQLATLLEDLAADPERVETLAAAPPPDPGDALAPYTAPVPTPRHPRSQAGLATAAVYRVAEVADPPRPRRRASQAARALLRVLPEPAARVAVRVLPQRLKDRFREVADWRVEEARRAGVRRAAAVADRIAAGAFPELADPLVSVVIPCFNHGAFLEEALLSVFEQTFTSFEVLVIDDGSTEPETRAVLDALDWPRTRLIRQENRGLSAARNTGMRVARGSLLVPLDADDEIAPTFLAEMHAALEKDPAAAYAHCWSELFGDVTATWVARPFNPYLLTSSNSVVGCVLLRRAAWEDAGGYDETLLAGNEDWDLWLRLLERGWGHVQVRRPLFRYRQHGVSMSVLTEARFETARQEIAARHPDLYDPAARRRLKAEWYPWVSLIVDPAAPGEVHRQTLSDAEVVPLGTPDAEFRTSCEARGWPVRTAAAEPIEAVRTARGKLVVLWSDVESAAPEALAELAEALEDTKAEAAAGPGGATGPVPLLWRRWALVDPGAGLTGTLAVSVTATPAAGAVGTLAPGCAPLPEWTTSGAPPHRPVLRHGPEGEGPLPDPPEPP